MKGEAILTYESLRIVIPIKRYLLPEDIVSKAIPTLSDRQFVLTKSNLTSAEEKTQRELFWYREELFKSIRGRWREVSLQAFFPFLLNICLCPPLPDWRNSLRGSLFTTATSKLAYVGDLTDRSCPGANVTGAI